MSTDTNKTKKWGDPTEFDTDLTDEPVCPHCGYIYSDAWEIGSDSLEFDDEVLEFGKCEKEFLCLREVTITYSTTKLEEK